jgi:hypothetical protein
MAARASRHRVGAQILAVAVVLVVAAGLYWFEPWRLFTNTTVNDAAPAAVIVTSPPDAAGTAPAVATEAPTPEGPVVVRSGAFISYEHQTSGSASLIALAEGGFVIRFEDLDTSDGPDLHVYLSPLDHTAGMTAFGRSSVELGELKGNRGNQNYAVPSDIKLADYRSVVIWCKRFSVAFGAAPLI